MKFHINEIVGIKLQANLKILCFSNIIFKVLAYEQIFTLVNDTFKILGPDHADLISTQSLASGGGTYLFQRLRYVAAGIRTPDLPHQDGYYTKCVTTILKLQIMYLKFYALVFCICLLERHPEVSSKFYVYTEKKVFHAKWKNKSIWFTNSHTVLNKKN